MVREATCEALASYAQGFTRLYGCEVPGSSNAPVVRVVFECLSEQKKESQMGASQALLKVRLGTDDRLACVMVLHATSAKALSSFAKC